eukprot:scaffold284809_cov37-Tisochrysis_lutea.AAC.1
MNIRCLSAIIQYTMPLRNHTQNEGDACLWPQDSSSPSTHGMDQASFRDSKIRLVRADTYSKHNEMVYARTTELEQTPRGLRICRDAPAAELSTSLRSPTPPLSWMVRSFWLLS